MRINVPRLNDLPQDIELIAGMYDYAVGEARRGITIPIDFRNCDFLRPSAVVTLGGLIAQVTHIGGDTALLKNTLHPRVQDALQKNGFLASHGLEKRRKIAGPNAVTYRHDSVAGASDFAAFLAEEWLGRHWFGVESQVKQEILGTVVELYNNAFEHGQSETGFFTCGQLFPNKGEVVLALVDFGKTIPAVVRTLPSNRSMSDSDAILWALQPGHTTGARGGKATPRARLSRGLGFDVLLDLVAARGSHMEIYSSTGSVRAVGRKPLSKDLAFKFPGTLIQITVSTSGTLEMLKQRPKPVIEF